MTEEEDSVDIKEGSVGGCEGKGRGRGRGRGGVPLLPTGVWEAINGGNDRTEPIVEQFLAVQSDQPKIRSGEDDRAEDEEERYRDSNNDVQDMSSFGFSNFGGKSRGRNDDHGSASKSRDKDIKGKDWACHSCSNVNWSWRSTCNKCGIAKMVTLVTDEERDGVGGGFNERQDRASSNSVEVDEEGFDDFGRRVKRSSANDRQSKAEAALRRMQEKYRHLIPGEVPSSTANISSAPHSSQPHIPPPPSNARREEYHHQKVDQHRRGGGGGEGAGMRGPGRDRDDDRKPARRDSRDPGARSRQPNSRDDRDRDRDRRRRSRSRSNDRRRSRSRDRRY